MNIAVEISGVIEPIRNNSISIEDRIEERSVASFVVKDKFGLREFEKGEPVTIGYQKSIDTSSLPSFSKFDFIPFDFGVFSGGIERELENIVFKGVVQNSEKKVLRLFPSVYAEHIVTCVDNHYFADKRLAAKSYVQEDVKDIVIDLLETYLTEEGITVGQIDSGVDIEEVVFNYVPVSQALDTLAERTGFWWRIDKDKKLYFLKRQAILSGITINNSNVLAGTVRLVNDNSKYRNQQIIKGTKNLTSPQAEIFKGDGVQSTFVVAYPIAKVPTVEVSNDYDPTTGTGTWTPQTVGIRDLEEGKDWYWSSGETNISQDFNATKLTENQYLRVTYQGEFSQIIISRDPTEIIRVREIEQSGTGIVEAVQTETQQTTRDAAFQLAGQLLQQYGTIGRTLTFVTRESGLEPGQLVKVEMPDYSLDTEMLIQEVKYSMQSSIEFYEVTCIEGPETKSWTSMFEEIYKAGQYKERENVSVGEVVIIPYNFEKEWQETEQPNIFKETYPTGQTPSNNLFPSFAPEDRVKYLEWHDTNGAVQRKAITQQSEQNGDLLTVTFMSPEDGAGINITKFVWIGGIEATSTLGTGITVDEQTETTSEVQAPWQKTTLESWQVEKLDRRW